MSARITESTGFEDSGFALMSRVRGSNGSLITQAAISTIAYSTYSRDAESNDAFSAGASGTLTVADVVFDELQIDSRWGKDSTGYNFRWDVPASIVADGGKLYRLEIKFTPASGEAFHIVHHHKSLGLERS